MAFSIEGFKGNFRGAGARPSQFEVLINQPLNFIGAPVEKLRFTCKAASLPTSTIGTTIPKYFGREVKLAGDATFPPWNITVLNDEDMLVRTTLESWRGMINGHESNLNKYPSADPAHYKADAFVYHYGKNGELIKAYQFVGLFPTNIGEIQLSWDASDTIEEFSVTFDYDYWLVSPVAANPAGLTEVL